MKSITIIGIGKLGLGFALILEKTLQCVRY